MQMGEIVTKEYLKYEEYTKECGFIELYFDTLIATYYPKLTALGVDKLAIKIMFNNWAVAVIHIIKHEEQPAIVAVLRVDKLPFESGTDHFLVTRDIKTNFSYKHTRRITDDEADFKVKINFKELKTCMLQVENY